jgi:hypothetical protein
MEKLRLKVKQIQSGLSGTLMLEAQELVDDLTDFLCDEHRYARERKQREPEYELFFDMQIQRWYKRRSLNANGLAWELATRLGQADRVSKEVAYYAVKELVDLPRDEYKGIFVSRSSGELTTVEFARFIQALMIECQMHVPAVEIRDIWILFTEWRFGQEKDPLEGTYYGPEDYKEKHPCCEACGRFLLHTDEKGDQKHSGEISHIVSVGAGGGTGARDDWLWLVLCSKCHLCIQHAGGWQELLTLYPHLCPKVDRARERAGKKPLSTADGGQGAVQPVAEPPASATATVAVAEAPPPNAQAEIVKQVFEGEVVQLAPIAEPGPPVDEAKERMLARLQGLEKTTKDRQQRYYPPAQQTLFDEPPAPTVDPKKAQYKDDEKDEPEPAEEQPAVPAYDKDGNFALPPEF